MKKLIVVVAVVLILTERVSAQEITVNQQQQQEQKQEQSQQMSGISGIIEEREVVQGILPDLPLHQFIPPERGEESFWNDWAVAPVEKAFTRQEVNYALKNTGVPFAEYLTGTFSFLCPIKKDYVPSGLAKTNRIELLLKAPAEKFATMRPIVVRGDERFSKQMLLDAALKLAMENGAARALLVGDGLNTAHLGKSVGLPFGVVSADANSSFSGGVGIARSSLKKIGEPWLAVIPIK